MSRNDNNDSLCWFHGKLSREDAELLIKQEGKEDGAFLIRESNTAEGDFVLTLLYQDEVVHYQIRRHGNDAFFSIDDKVKILHGLETLVEFYQQAANGLITKLTTFIKKSPPPNDARGHGVSNLLHRATQSNNQTVVSELLKCGYRNVDAKNENGQTAVHLAAIYCDEAILKLLLDAGVNVNCKDTFEYAPLHYACRAKPASFIRTLIAAQANVQGRNLQNGYVPLHEAAKHGNLDAVKELLAAHAPLLPRTTFGEFPIDLAREADQQVVVEFLEKYKQPAASTSKSEWYHGTLTRDEAVRAVQAHAEKIQRDAAAASGPDAAATDVPAVLDTSGCFLVRFSARKEAGSGYVLTLLFAGSAKNFIISQSSSYLYIDEGPYLPSLEHLVEHFMHFTDGLPVSLKYAVPPQPKPPVPHFSTMPRSRVKKASADALLAPNMEQLEPEQIIPQADATRKHSLGAHKLHGVEKHSQTLTSKKKHKENSVFNTLNFNTLRSLRKLKVKAIAPTSEPKSPPPAPAVSAEEELEKSPCKGLSFETKLTKLQLTSESEDAPNREPTTTPTPVVAPPLPTAAPPASATTDDCFYNVPQNNAAVQPDSVESAANEIESKTEAEVEYFTRSDVAIEQERLNAGPSAAEPFKNCPAKFAPNANGYIPTVDVRVFLDQNGAVLGDFSQELIEASAELRELSYFPERLDSLMSTASTESAIMRYLNRQNSSASTMTQSSEAATSSAALPGKLSYFIPVECLQLGAIIGEGEFGSVFKGHLVRRGNAPGTSDLRCEVAIKTLRTNKQEFLREASVMIRLQHHCIVQLIGISRSDTLMMVLELVPLGSMLNYILTHRDKINPNYELKLWASQVACGMQYLESRHYVHRDLAARNILLASRNQAKISDFGFSRAIGAGSDCYEARQGGRWPIKWYAPESYKNGVFSHASDVWSFGVTLWEMFSLGEQPYGDMRGFEAMQLIESGERLPQPAPCPVHVYDIMQNCWNYKPKDRPTFRYLTEFFARDPDYQNLMELVKTEHIN